MYALYALAVRKGERRPLAELALRSAPVELLTGVAIGLGMFALVFTSLHLAGLYTLLGPFSSDWGTDILRETMTALFEELLFRAVVFRLLMRAFGLTGAFCGSALLFGALHLGNPNATLFAAVAIALEAGLMLASFYALTGRLWMSIGVHTAWNFAQGPLFGAPVSGTIEKSSVFRSAPMPGHDILTGGAFGPEASLSVIIAGMVVFAIVLAAIRRGARVTVPTGAVAPPQE